VLTVTCTAGAAPLGSADRALFRPLKESQVRDGPSSPAPPFVPPARVVYVTVPLNALSLNVGLTLARFLDLNESWSHYHGLRMGFIT
jgi:hypothetical protein